MKNIFKYLVSGFGAITLGTFLWFLFQNPDKQILKALRKEMGATKFHTVDIKFKKKINLDSDPELEEIFFISFEGKGVGAHGATPYLIIKERGVYYKFQGYTDQSGFDYTINSQDLDGGSSEIIVTFFGGQWNYFCVISKDQGEWRGYTLLPPTGPCKAIFDPISKTFVFNNGSKEAYIFSKGNFVEIK
ncbi:MAG: hypothetical protein QXP53_01360 [Candidatus Pacearchaeota archaeon]